MFDHYEDATTHPMRAQRVAKLPRWEFFSEIKTTYLLTKAGLEDQAGSDELHAKIDGPTSLKHGLNTGDEVNGRSVEEMLAAEVHRLERAAIASFLHPSAQGAKSYAYWAMKRYQLRKDAIAALTVIKLPDPNPLPLPIPQQRESLDKRLRRFKLRSGGSVSSRSRARVAC